MDSGPGTASASQPRSQDSKPGLPRGSPTPQPAADERDGELPGLQLEGGSDNADSDAEPDHRVSYHVTAISNTSIVEKGRFLIGTVKHIP